MAAKLDARIAVRLVIILSGLMLADDRRVATAWFMAGGVQDDWDRFYDCLITIGRKSCWIAVPLLSAVVRKFDPGPNGHLTLCGNGSPTQRYGKHVEGAGVHHHPTPGTADSEWLYGHNWVSLCVLTKHLLWGVIAEGLWPAEGKKSLGGQVVHLGIAWKPAGHWERRVGNRLHISDIWLDEAAMQRAKEHQIKVHQELIRGRWMPAWVDAVEYGKFGGATVTATVFGGMDPSLYADFKKGIDGQMAVSDTQLKHSQGWVRHSLVAVPGPILDVARQGKEVPLGSSGIQIRMKVDQLAEGFRPGKIVRIRPKSWPDDTVPREEYTDGHLEELFPTPAIFPDYKDKQ